MPEVMPTKGRSAADGSGLLGRDWPPRPAPSLSPLLECPMRGHVKKNLSSNTELNGRMGQE